MQDQAASGVAEVGASLATKATYAGSVTTVAGALASVDWVAVTGLLIALFGFALNAYFQIKKNRREERESEMRQQREQELHELEIKRRKGECNVK